MPSKQLPVIKDGKLVKKKLTGKLVLRGTCPGCGTHLTLSQAEILKAKDVCPDCGAWFAVGLPELRLARTFRCRPIPRLTGQKKSSDDRCLAQNVVPKQPIVNFAVFALFVAIAIPNIWLAILGAMCLNFKAGPSPALWSALGTLWSALGTLPSVTNPTRILLAVAISFFELLVTYKIFQYLHDDDIVAKQNRVGKWTRWTDPQTGYTRRAYSQDMNSPVTASDTGNFALEERPSFKYGEIVGVLTFLLLIFCAICSFFLLCEMPRSNYQGISLLWKLFGTWIVVSLVPYLFFRYYYDAFRNLKAKRWRGADD